MHSRRGSLFHSKGYYPICLFVALIVLVLLIGTGQSLWLFPDEGMSWTVQTGQVYAVVSDGPAFEAGIRSGDRLVSIDGLPLSQAFSIYPHKLAGDTILYTVWREGGQRTAPVVVRSAGIRKLIDRFEPLTIGLVFWLMGLLVWILQPFARITQLFFLMSQAVAATLAAGGLSTRLFPIGIRAFSPLLVLCVALMLHLCLYFPCPIERRYRRWILGLSYGVNGLIALAYLVSFMQSSDPFGPRFLWAARYGAVAVTLLASLALVLRGQQAADLVVQRRRLLIAGVIASLFPLLTFSLLPSLLGLPLRLEYTWTLPFLCLLPIFFGYALLRGKLGPVDLFVNRNLVYFLILYVMFFFSLAVTMAMEGLPTISMNAHRFLAAGIVVTLAALVHSARALFQRGLDHVLYGGWYDYRTVIQKMSQEFASIQEKRELVERLLETARTMRFRAAALLWPQQGEMTVAGSQGFTAEEQARLVTLAGALSHTTLLQPQVRPEWTRVSAERVPADALAVAEVIDCWLPLVSRGIVRALFVLARRQGGEQPDRGDIELLGTVAAQAAVAAENIELLDTLRGQVAELEEAQQEIAEVRRKLVTQRESERHFLARELHDRPVQELEAIRLRLGTWTQDVPLPAEQGLPAIIQEHLQQALDSLRSICQELRPVVLAPFGLAAAIRSDAERFREAHPHIQVQLDLMADGQALPEPTRLAFYRIYREAMCNAERHAHATRLVVRFWFDDAQVALEVQDNGRGFGVPGRWVELGRQGHLGLLGAAEQAEAIGARLEVDSQPSKGTTLRVLARRAGDNRASCVDGGNADGADSCSTGG